MDDPGTAALNEVLGRYDLLEVQHGSGPDEPTYLVVQERALAAPPARRTTLAASMSTVELGTASASPFTSWLRTERVPELHWPLSIQKYLQMKRGDGTVRGSLRMLKTPILGAHWFVEPYSDSNRDKNVARFVWENLEDRLNVSWPRLLTYILMYLDYGHMVFEKVFTDPATEDDGRTRWKKFALRHPADIADWVYDDNGGPAGVVVYAGANETFIPIEKLLVFSFEDEAGDLLGTSVLRSAYKHWFYKETLYKIDALAKERHGIGVPVVKLPMNASDDDKNLASELGRNLRTNERAHVVLPAGWDLIFAKLEGNPVDCIASIDHHDKQMEKNILAPFMDTGGNDDEQSLFLKSTKTIADDVCDIFNRHAIPQLVNFNFPRIRDKYPKLRARRIAEWEDMRTMSFTLRNLVGAQLITPDEPLEAALRKDLDLPPFDPQTARRVPSPQNPGSTNDPNNPNNPNNPMQNMPGTDANVGRPPKPPRVGLPRQSLPSVGLPQSHAGRDGRGGNKPA